MPSTHKIVRRTVNWPVNRFQAFCDLPAETTIFRIHNLDDNPIDWAEKDSVAPTTGPTPDPAEWTTLEGHCSEIPPIVPEKLYVRRTSTATSPVVVVIWTTSKDPATMARVASMAIGTTISDIEIGAVELKDGSIDARVTVTSGGDSINRLQVIVGSGQISISGQVIVNVSGQEATMRTEKGSGAMVALSSLAWNLLTSNPARLETTVRNVSPVAATVSIGFDSGVTGSNSPISLLYGDVWNTQKYTGNVWAIAAAGSGMVTIARFGE